jgi:hypothetical protein
MPLLHPYHIPCYGPYPSPHAVCDCVFYAQALTCYDLRVQALMCILMLTPTTLAHRAISTTAMHVFRSTSIRAFKGAATPTYGPQHELLVVSMFSKEEGDT